MNFTARDKSKFTPRVRYAVEFQSGTDVRVFCGLQVGFPTFHGYGHEAFNADRIECPISVVPMSIGGAGCLVHSGTDFWLLSVRRRYGKPMPIFAEPHTNRTKAVCAPLTDREPVGFK